jgi:hypothetical protein
MLIIVSDQERSFHISVDLLYPETPSEPQPLARVVTFNRKEETPKRISQNISKIKKQNMRKKTSGFFALP